MGLNAEIHEAAAETASIIETRDRRLPCNFLFVVATGVDMRRWFLTWAIEDRHGDNGFFSEVIEGDDWESHVAKTVERQQPNDSGRFVARWRLVMLVEMQGAGSDRLKEVIDRCEQ